MERSTDEEDLLKEEKENANLISPPSGAETLFLGAALETSDVTARTLSERLQRNNNQYFLCQRKENNYDGIIRKSGSFHTAQTRGSYISVGDFMSCVENASDIDSIGSNENSLNSPLAVRPSRFCVETAENTINNNSSNKMSIKLQKVAKKKVIVPEKASTIEKKPPLPDVVLAAPITTSVAPYPIVSEDEQIKVYAAEIVYGKAKDILAWGKSVPVVSFFVGTSEAVAGKALGVVGTDLSTLDGKIESELTKFDTGILNPAIEAIANVLIGVAGKSEETIKPIIDAILKPLGMLIKSETNEQSPEARNETPEVTVAK